MFLVYSVFQKNLVSFHNLITWPILIQMITAREETTQNSMDNF